MYLLFSYFACLLKSLSRQDVNNNVLQSEGLYLFFVSYRGNWSAWCIQILELKWGFTFTLFEILHNVFRFSVLDVQCNETLVFLLELVEHFQNHDLLGNFYLHLIQAYFIFFWWKRWCFLGQSLEICSFGQERSITSNMSMLQLWLLKFTHIRSADICVCQSLWF